MLAEIFMLKAEATARESKEGITRSTAQFGPITLPAAPAATTSVPTFASLDRNGQAAKGRLDCIAAPAIARAYEHCNSAEIRERRLAAKGRAFPASLTLSQAGSPKDACPLHPVKAIADGLRR